MSHIEVTLLLQFCQFGYARGRKKFDTSSKDCLKKCFQSSHQSRLQLCSGLLRNAGTTKASKVVGLLRSPLNAFLESPIQLPAKLMTFQNHRIPPPTLHTRESRRLKLNKSSRTNLALHFDQSLPPLVHTWHANFLTTHLCFAALTAHFHCATFKQPVHPMPSLRITPKDRSMAHKRSPPGMHECQSVQLSHPTLPIKLTTLTCAAISTTTATDILFPLMNSDVANPLPPSSLKPQFHNSPTLLPHFCH